MNAVIRFDRGGRLDRAKRTSIGGAYIPARLSRTGVLAYSTPTGVRRELRHPDEVFNADSLASLDSVPVIDIGDHTSLVSPDEYRRAAVGHVKTAHRDGSFIASELVVQDSATLDAIDAGERTEISCGYVCKLDMTPGVYEGEAYDCVQREIRYNHVALCPPNRGRAGAEVGLRLDARHGGIEEIDPVVRLDRLDRMLSLKRAERDAILARLGHARRLDALVPAPARRTVQIADGIDIARREVSIIASTTAPVDGEALLSWDLARYGANPVVLWMHDRIALPIGIAEEVAFDPSVGLKMRVRFASAQANPLGEQVWRAVCEGIVRAVSVGFEPGPATESTLTTGEIVIERTNNVLLEVSFVTIGADEDAGTAALNPEAARSSSRPPSMNGGAIDDDEKDDDDERARVSSAARELALHGASKRFFGQCSKCGGNHEPAACDEGDKRSARTDANDADLDAMLANGRKVQAENAANAWRRPR